MKKLLLITLAFLASAALHAADAAHPNIIFIFSDDHAVNAIGAYDQWLGAFCREQKITPHIDKLASEGALFTHCFCGNSLCSPSRATVLTGLHSHANGVRVLAQAITPGLWTFPPALQAAGYQTALFGKWHLDTEPAGFDTYRIVPGQGIYWNPVFTGPNKFREKIDGYATDIITGKCLDWLKGRDPKKPFMLCCYQKAPHRNWQPPARYFGLFDGVTLPEPTTLFDYYDGRGTAAHNQKMEIGRDMTMASDLKLLPHGEAIKGLTPADTAAWLETFGKRNDAFHASPPTGNALTRWKYQEYMKDYLRCVKAVDDSAAKLTEFLEQNGLAQNTIVIYSSDQGFYTGEHGWFDKRWIYEESLHMPLIVKWPGVVKPGTKIDAFAQNIDFAPTFTDMTGAATPEKLHGRSLVPLLKGTTPPDWRDRVYYHFYDDSEHAVAKHFGMRTQQFTIADFYTLGEWELYDLQKDPQQMHSVANDPDYAGKFNQLKQELQTLKTQFGDTSDQAKKKP